MLLSLRGTIAIDERMGRGMETNESLQRENCKTYYLVLYLVAAIAVSEVFLGWYLVSRDYGSVSYIRIFFTVAVLVGLWL
jgi:hypothetical protein